VRAELARAGSPRRADRWAASLQEAATAYDAERFHDARRLLEPLASAARAVPAVRELLGLTTYRLGRWSQAVTELEAAEDLSDSVDQHPVLADAHRALGHADAVERLWDELRRGGVGVEVLTEGRIVTAGTRADEGDLRGAIALLEEGPVAVSRPREHHLRLWYALAALYEQAGDVPRARALLGRLVAAEPGFADAARRLESLR
jgi:tetratricopeptide (TPR) repeat protein